MKKVFISYAHEDEKYKDDLRKHLKTLERLGKIEVWDDRSINASDEWREQIMNNLEDSDIILMLISPDFIASDFCFDIELERAIQKHDEGKVRVIPVIIRTCDWTDFYFSKLHAVPKNAKPISSFTNKDEAYTFIVKQIKTLVEKLEE